MSRKVCPRCGFVQPQGEECLRCGVIFARYQKPQTGSSPDPAQLLGPAGPGRRLWRALRWASLAAVLLALVLVFWSPRRPGPADPQAVHSAETKFMEHERLTRAGRPHTLELNQPELNGWLETHLDYSGEGSAQAASVATADEKEIERVRSTVRDVKVELLDDGLRAFVVFDLHGIDLTLMLMGRLFVQDGYLRFEPASGRLGGLPLPRSALQSAVQRVFDNPENRDKFRLPSHIRDLGIRRGRLYVESR